MRNDTVNMVLDIRTVLEVAGLVIASLLLIISIQTHILSRTSDPGTEEPALYQDEDGEASEDTQKAYTVRLQNFLLVPTSVAGFSIALAEAVIGQLHSWSVLQVIWMDFALWVGSFRSVSVVDGR
jgi:hypothetical protein